MRNGTAVKIEAKDRKFIILWLRHGMTKANEEHRYLGLTEEDLSKAGIQQLKGWREKRQEEIDFLVSSPMKRCIQTAGLLWKKEPDWVIPQWREMDFGLFEGKNYEELKDNPAYQSWIDSNGTTAFPQGESREQFIERSISGLKKMLSLLDQELEKKALPSKREIPVIAAVVHGGTIMAVLSSICNGDYFDFQVKNGKGYRTTLEIKNGQLFLLNKEEI